MRFFCRNAPLRRQTPPASLYRMQLNRRFLL